jgi:hypothetical protein
MTKNSGMGIAGCKERGEWAELCFMARAAGQGLRVSKPYGDSAKAQKSEDAPPSIGFSRSCGPSLLPYRTSSSESPWPAKLRYPASCSNAPSR